MPLLDLRLFGWNIRPRIHTRWFARRWNANTMPQELLFRNHTYVRQQGPLFLLSVIVGIVGGLGAVAFRLLIGGNQHLFFGKILSVVSLHVGSLNLGIILLPALGGLIVGLLVDRFAPEAKGHGVPEVIEAVHFRGGVIRPVVAADRCTCEYVGVQGDRGTSLGASGVHKALHRVLVNQATGLPKPSLGGKTGLQTRGECLLNMVSRVCEKPGPVQQL